MRYARIDNDQLVEISPETEESLATWQARFHPSNHWVPHDGSAGEGDVYDEVTETFSPPPPPPIADQKATALAAVRQQAQAHIEAVWPLWRQINADAGIYPPAVKDQKDADVAAVIAESNRVEDLIDAATDGAGITAALDSLNWPTLGG